MADNTHLPDHCADGDAVRDAAAILQAGGLVAVPTETVYGLAARADDAAAVAAIYRAKGRPAFNPLIVHVADVIAAQLFARFDDRARALAARFWPGPMTLVLPLREDAGLAPAVSAGLATVALRSPAHPVMQALLRETGLPLAAPSANRSGAVSPSTPDHVRASFGAEAPFILDGGPCAEGIESTIVALRADGSWQVLRPGPIAAAAIAAVLGAAPEVHTPSDGHVEAPGQLASHYSPGKPVRLHATAAAADEFLIGFGDVVGDVSLSDSGEVGEAALRLYACLHAAAASAKPRIAIAPVPNRGIGEAVNDRLKRAAC